MLACAWQRALRSAITGWHIEGPFLSKEPGYHGAHDPRYMIDPSPEHIRTLRDIAKSDPVLLTLAPERPGAIAAIALAVSLGMKVSLGHTNASAEQLGQAVQAGATGFTHLGNGCPAELNRHDNILWRVVETPGLMTSLIPDQIHVSPALFRTIHRLIRSESIYYTTDAMAAAGASPGRYTIGHLNVEVGPDQIVRHPGQTNFAGSALRPIDGVFRAARMLKRPWQEVWNHASVFPARFMGFAEDNLEVGQPASFCALETGEENRVTKLQVWLNGEPMVPA
jgi:N-acetylglucosamine-6-phosphate deacetylase